MLCFTTVFLSFPFQNLFFFRARENEVHVTVGCAYPKVEPSYNEVGAFSGSDSREQQCRRAQGEGWASLLAQLSPLYVVFIVDTTQLILINSLLFTAQWDEWHSSWKSGVCKGRCIAVDWTAHSLILLDIRPFSRLIHRLLLLISMHRVEERFRVTYPCWRFIRTWTGTLKYRLLTCGLCTYATTELWSSTGKTWSSPLWQDDVSVASNLLSF